MASRRPVVDAQQHVAGYRIAYATRSQDSEDSGGVDATLKLFDDALSVVGSDDLVGPSVAHLPISPQSLLAVGVPPVRPDRVLLRVGYSDARDPALADVFGRLAGRGYSLALDGLPGPDFDFQLLNAFGTVEIDLATWTDTEIIATLPQIRGRRARPIATGVGDHDAFDRARAHGFELFEGPFYTQPRPRPQGDFGFDRAGLASLLRLQTVGASIEELNRIIEQDVGLSVKLLRYLNSAYLARRGTISSIKQAVMMLGTKGVARWALLIALTAGSDTPREIARIALTRARLCESLADDETGPAPEELFTIGMLSLADALLGIPLDEAFKDMPVTEDVSGAVLRHEGRAGAILEAAIEYERGNFGLPLLQQHRTTLLDGYRNALRWANDTLAAVA